MKRMFNVTLIALVCSKFALAVLPCEEDLKKNPPKNKLVVHLYEEEETAKELFLPKALKLAANEKIALGLEGKSRRAFALTEENGVQPLGERVIIEGIESDGVVNFVDTLNVYLDAVELRPVERHIREALENGEILVVIGHDIDIYRKFRRTLLHDSSMLEMSEQLARRDMIWNSPEAFPFLEKAKFMRILTAEERREFFEYVERGIDLRNVLGAGEVAYHLLPGLMKELTLEDSQKEAFKLIPAKFEESSGDAVNPLRKELVEKLRTDSMSVGIAKLYCRATLQDPNRDVWVMVEGKFKPAVEKAISLAAPRAIPVEFKDVR